MRRLFFGLGVLLGLVSPEAPPQVAARVFRQAEAVHASVELEGAFPASALELAEAGTEVAWSAAIEVTGGERREESALLRSLRFDGASGTWVVRLEPEGEEKRLRDRAAAVVLASRAWAARIAPLPGPGRALGVRIVARPGILDPGGGWHPAGILWGYAEPSVSFGFASAEAIPY